MSLKEALEYELKHPPQPNPKAWTIKDALAWEAAREKERK